MVVPLFHWLGIRRSLAGRLEGAFVRFIPGCVWFLLGCFDDQSRAMTVMLFSMHSGALLHANSSPSDFIMPYIHLTWFDPNYDSHSFVATRFTYYAATLCMVAPFKCIKDIEFLYPEVASHFLHLHFCGMPWKVQLCIEFMHESYQG